MKLAYIDIVIIIAYLVLCLYLSVFKSGKAKNLNEFAVGPRQLPIFSIVAVLFSTAIGAGSTVGIAGQVYTLGLIFAAQELFTPFVWWTTSYCFARNIEKFRDCISLPDIMDMVYGPIARWISVCTSIIMCCVIVGGQLSAIGYMINHFTGLDNSVGIIMGAVIVCIYISVGGARALVVSDLLQFTIFYIAIPTACALAFGEVGGIEGLQEKLPPKLLTIDLTNIDNLLLLTSLIAVCILPEANSAFIQRLLMSKSSLKLRQALYSLLFIHLPFGLMVCLIGLIIRALEPNINPNHAFYHLISHYLPAGMIGFLISGLLSAIMSTISSWLNSAGVIFSKDIIGLIRPNMSPKETLRTAKISTIFMTVTSILIAMRGAGVIETIWHAYNFWYPIMMVPMILAFRGIELNGKMFVISMVCAVSATFYGSYLAGGKFGTISLFVGMSGSALGFIFFYWLPKRYRKFVTKRLAPLAITPKRIKKLIILPLTIQINRVYKDTTKTHYYMFCMFIFLQYVPYIFLRALEKDMHINVAFSLHIMGIVLTIFLLAFEHWPKEFRKKVLPTYWCFTLLLCLPFISAYMLLASNQPLWIINAALSAVILSLFVTIANFAAITILGVLLALITFGVFGSSSSVSILPGKTLEALGSIYAIIALLSAFIARKLFETRLNELNDTAKFIAHEAKSPLATISMALDVIVDIIKNAKILKKTTEHTVIVEIDTDSWLMMQDLLRSSDKTSQSGIRMIETILHSYKEEYQDVGIYSLISCIKTALGSYHYQDTKDKNRVSFKAKASSDIKFHGSKLAMQHVIVNLLSNSLKYAGKKATIEISIERHKLIFRDNGAGIPEEILANLFEHNTSTKGFGIGLYYCMRIMQLMGGNILCDSVLGKYTTFTLIFPDYD